jgi:hypothetical protein
MKKKKKTGMFWERTHQLIASVPRSWLILTLSTYRSTDYDVITLVVVSSEGLQCFFFLRKKNGSTNLIHTVDGEELVSMPIDRIRLHSLTL